MNFRFLNIPVVVHPTFWIALLFFSDICRDPSIESLLWGVIFAVSLLIHEYGHALTAKRFGAKPTITLWALGGYAQYNSWGITPFQSFIITLNGPLFNCALIALSYALLKLDVVMDHPYLWYCLSVTMRLNILWCLLNLIPVSPLDGGQMVRFLLEKRFGEAGVKASVIIGLISVILIAPYLFFKGFYFFGTLLVIYGIQSSQTSQIMQPSVEGFNRSRSNNKTDYKKLLKSKDLEIKHHAIESLAQEYYQENEPQKSYVLLMKANPQFLKAGKCLLCKLALEQKNYALIAHYSREIYAREPTFEIALLNSKAFAGLKQPTLAGAWLVTASQFGESYRKAVIEALLQPIYDPVRESAPFVESLEKADFVNTL